VLASLSCIALQRLWSWLDDDGAVTESLTYAVSCETLAICELLHCSCDLLAHSLLAAAEANNALLTSFMP
jgi:hypothetical protein